MYTRRLPWSRASRATFFVTAADPRYIPDDESFLFPVQLRLLTPIRSPIPFESFGPGASPKGCPMFVRSAFRPQIPFSGLISLHCVLYIVTFILCTVWETKFSSAKYFLLLNVSCIVSLILYFWHCKILSYLVLYQILTLHMSKFT